MVSGRNSFTQRKSCHFLIKIEEKNFDPNLENVFFKSRPKGI